MRKFIDLLVEGAEEGSDISERKAWNRIMRMMSFADEQGILDDNGLKKDTRTYYEFSIGDHWFKIIKDD